jgi:DHA2 family multidrug resistance protein
MSAASPEGARPGRGPRLSSLNPGHRSYRWWVLLSVMIGTFMAVLDATVVNVALAKIMGVFGVTLDAVEWVMTAYLLVFGIVLACSGWVADHLGHKRTYVLALSLFTVGSLFCSLSWSFESLIVFRVIQGSGAGFLLPVGMAIITREYPPEQRGMALGFWSVAAAASVSLGPMIGGYLVDYFSWHTIFDVNVPIGIVGVTAAVIIQREYKAEETRKFDFVGFLSLIVFLGALLLALANGNAAWNTGGWTSRYILTCFTLSVVGLVVFLVTEFTVEHPLINLALFKDLNFSMANLVLFIFGLGMFGSVFLLPLYLQNSLGYTAFQAGLFFLPVGILQGAVAPVAGIVADRLAPKVPALIGILLLTFSFYLNRDLSLFSSHAQIENALIFRGLGLGLIFAPLSALALANISRAQMAQASGMFNVIRQVGGSFGVAIFGTLMIGRTALHVTNFGTAIQPYSPALNAALMRLQGFARHAAGGTAAESAARAKALLYKSVGTQASVAAVDDAFLVAAGITAVCAAVLFLMKSPKKRRGRGPVTPGPSPSKGEMG